MTLICPWCKNPISEKEPRKFFVPEQRHYHDSCFELKKLREISEREKTLNRREIPWNLLQWE